MKVTFWSFDEIMHLSKDECTAPKLENKKIFAWKLDFSQVLPQTFSWFCSPGIHVFPMPQPEILDLTLEISLYTVFTQYVKQINFECAPWALGWFQIDGKIYYRKYL